MRQLKTTLFALLLAAPVLAAPGGARPGGGPGFGSGHGPGRGPGGPGAGFEQRAERIADVLQLTDAQRAAFDQMRADGMAAAQPKMDRMRALGDELRALLDSGSDDARAVGEKAIALHRLRGELKVQREAAQAEFVKLLDEKQRFAFEAFREARDERRESWGRRPGPGFEPGGPEPDFD